MQDVPSVLQGFDPFRLVLQRCAWRPQQVGLLLKVPESVTTPAEPMMARTIWG